MSALFPPSCLREFHRSDKTEWRIEYPMPAVWLSWLARWPHFLRRQNLAQLDGGENFPANANTQHGNIEQLAAIPHYPLDVRA